MLRCPTESQTDLNSRSLRLRLNNNLIAQSEIGKSHLLHVIPALWAVRWQVMNVRIEVEARDCVKLTIKVLKYTDFSLHFTTRIDHPLYHPCSRVQVTGLLPKLLINGTFTENPADFRAFTHTRVDKNTTETDGPTEKYWHFYYLPPGGLLNKALLVGASAMERSLPPQSRFLLSATN